jgi:tetratricopeptide (TPR) repeat protein
MRRQFLTFIVLITSMSCDSLAAKQEMLTECRAYYRNDPTQLSQIDEFERTYDPNDAIRWYTKPSFLFSLINKALRSGDIQALYTFRYFIKSICDRLKEASASHFNVPFQLYRGARLHRDEVKNLDIGFFVATTSFFSCSRNRRVAEMFIGVDSLTGKSPNRGREEKQQYVLFEIDVDLTKFPDTIVTDVSAQSEFPVEEEMIFMLSSTFIINKINYDSEKNLWCIQMSSVSDITRSVQKYDEYVQLRLQENSSMVWFGHTMATIESDYLYSIDYFHRLLRTLPINHTDRPVVYYNLGRIYRLVEKYHKALAYLRCARLLLRRLLPEGIFDYCRILSGIGIVYSELGDSKRALKWLEQAVSLQQKSLPDNHAEIPFHLNHIAYGYFKAKQFKQALSILYRADQFFKTRMTIEHKDHAQTLHISGMVYCALGDNEKAYSYFKEALYKRESLHVKDHPSVASTCYQLSLIHEVRGEYELALQYAKRSLRIQSIKLPHYHSELKQSIELVERLQLR